MITRDRARELLAYLSRMQHEGHSIVAWNRLSFDMRWLGHAAGDMQTAARVAMKLYDPMFQFYKLKGFPVGLDAVGKGLGGNQICVICVPYPQCPTRSSTIPF